MPIKSRRAFGFLVLRFVLPLDTNVSRRPGPIVFFRSCEFTIDSLIESVCHKQTALSCSHPSGSGPRSLPLQKHQATSRLSRDQNNVSTAPCSFIYPSIVMDVTDLVICPVGRGIQTRLTHGAGERDFEGSESLHISIHRCGGRPISPEWSQPTVLQDRPPHCFAYPNTRVKSKVSCRFII
jgi:hypothetical protein